MQAGRRVVPQGRRGVGGQIARRLRRGKRRVPRDDGVGGGLRGHDEGAVTSQLWNPLSQITCEARETHSPHETLKSDDRRGDRN